MTKRPLLPIVPNVVARMEHNFLFNPDHPEFPQVSFGLHHPVWWDARLCIRSA
jgi:RES domain-containing protein